MLTKGNAFTASAIGLSGANEVTDNAVIKKVVTLADWQQSVWFGMTAEVWMQILMMVSVLLIVVINLPKAVGNIVSWFKNIKKVFSKKDNPEK